MNSSDVLSCNYSYFRTESGQILSLAELTLKDTIKDLLDESSTFVLDRERIIEMKRKEGLHTLLSDLKSINTRVRGKKADAVFDEQYSDELLRKFFIHTNRPVPVMTSSETLIVRSRVAELYRTKSLPSEISLDSKIEVDGVSYDDHGIYLSEMQRKDNVEISMLLIYHMNKFIKKRLLSDKIFFDNVSMISPNTLESANDDDVMEMLNINLLEKFWFDLSHRTVEYKIEGEEENIKYITEHISDVIHRVLGDEPRYIDISTFLSKTFDCKGAIIRTPIPDYVSIILQKNGFVDENTRKLIWGYMELYIIFVGFHWEYEWQTENELIDRIDQIIEEQQIEIETKEQKLRRYIDIGDVRIYTIPTCPWCIKAKDLLNSNPRKYWQNGMRSRKFKTAYEEIILNDENRSKITEQIMMITEGKWTGTVPVIFVHDKWIGGYDQLATIFESK
jgi:glutaredoxin